MLSSVHIENIALIKSLDINFAGGFTAFTGETGAGKSIVIDSIGMAVGAKVSKDIIRAGESEARVEALFSDVTSSVLDKCKNLGIFADEDGCFFVTRTLNLEGKSVITVNGKRIPLSLLREFAPLLINIHGQHDNADLIRPEKHLEILDAFADNKTERNNYSNKYLQYCDIKSRISALTVGEMEKKRQIDILKFQIDEIKSAKLKDGEEETLKAEKNKLRYGEKINKHAMTCYTSLYDSENSRTAVECVEKAISSMNSLEGIIEGADNLSQRLENIKYELIDIAQTAIEFCDESAQDPTEALDRVESRLDKIKKLCSRYGADIKTVLEYCQDCENKLSDIESSEEKIKELEKEKTKIENELQTLSDALTNTRKNAAAKLSDNIEEILFYLDMKAAKFKTEFFASDDFTPSGKEKTEFFIKTNNGEGFHPLAKTASGGEISRVMLAIKSALAEKDGADTLIFDEIDTGISGSTSRKIGVKLKELATKKQVLCVTHSAQVSSLSDTHCKISKSVRDERTETDVNILNYDERVKEIARIISGMDISEASIISAKELIDGDD
ncbi:MAG: DNA repair protein RecN [Ruminococcaceae bacterium]|nr:DNA repair protein RecN [Oscillospiraceae bacterium]